VRSADFGRTRMMTATMNRAAVLPSTRRGCFLNLEYRARD